jgi:hypothetical protein
MIVSNRRFIEAIASESNSDAMTLISTLFYAMIASNRPVIEAISS